MAASLRIVVEAGGRARRNLPLSVELPGVTGPLELCARPSGKTIPAQLEAGALHFILEELAAGEELCLELTPGQGQKAPQGVVLDLSAREESIAITVSGKSFSTYHFSSRYARPFFWPLWGPGGVELTRNFPMKSELPGETQDHPHHRSL